MCYNVLYDFVVTIGIFREGLEAFQDFDKIIVTDELGRDYWKPNGKSFQLMARDLGVDYREMVYVGKPSYRRQTPDYGKN